MVFGDEITVLQKVYSYNLGGGRFVMKSLRGLDYWTLVGAGETPDLMPVHSPEFTTGS